MNVLGVIGAVLIGLGIFFSFAMTVGMLRFPDAYTRLHAGTKGLTVGVGLVLAGIAFRSPSALYALRIAFIAIFLFVTNPIAIHAAARANYRAEHARRRLIVDEYAEHLEEKNDV